MPPRCVTLIDTLPLPDAEKDAAQGSCGRAIMSGSRLGSRVRSNAGLREKCEPGHALAAARQRARRKT